MFEPNDELAMRLTAAEWNQIMAMLGKQPYELVANLIQKLNDQATAQHGRKEAAVLAQLRPNS